jgi:phosphomevalonate kinase
MLVASLGVVAARKGEDLRSDAVRRRIFDEARRAHAAVQGGGSGVDIAASVYGGAQSYTLGREAPEMAPVALSSRLAIEVYWCGSPASTPIMRARVDALKSRNPASYRVWIDGIASASRAFISSCAAANLAGVLKAARDGAAALESLGQAADAPIIPSGLAPLVCVAASDGAAFLPSGAGGGDVFVHLGAGPSSPSFRAAAESAGLRRLTMNIDTEGLRLVA